MKLVAKRIARLPAACWRIWVHRVTLVGRCFIIAAAVACIGFLSMEHLLYQVFVVAATLLVVSLVAGLFRRPHLTFDVNFPTRASSGETVTGYLNIANRSKRSAFDIVTGFEKLPSEFKQRTGPRNLPHLAAGQSKSIPVAVKTSRRGVFSLSPLYAASGFPFHLFHMGRVTVRLPTFTVVPAFTPLDEFNLPIANRLQSGGLAMAGNVGESPEYIGNRIYQPGESIRRLDFRAWARLGVPVVREFQEEYFGRVAIVLDTFLGPRRRKAGAGNAALEAAISMAAAVADALARGEYLIDIFAAGPEVHVFEAGRRRSHFDSVLDILACLESCGADPFATMSASLADQLGQISSTVVILLDWNESRGALVEQIAAANCEVKLMVVRDGPTSKPIDSCPFADVIQLHPNTIKKGEVNAI